MSNVGDAVSRFDRLRESLEDATEAVRDAALGAEERLDARDGQIRDLLTLTRIEHDEAHLSEPWPVCSSTLCRLTQELEAELELEQ